MGDGAVTPAPERPDLEDDGHTLNPDHIENILRDAALSRQAEKETA
jgi:hypothetical protein